ncbi:MAG TPA: hypothetical protein VJH33_00390 [Candidatus Paceibacterota bacterium]
MAERNIVPVEETAGNQHYPLRPHQISTRLIGTFGKREVEESAQKLLRFFQERGYWSSFTTQELRRFYEQQNWNPDTILWGLLGAWFNDNSSMCWRAPLDVYIAIGENGEYFVTEAFIKRCASQMQ